MKCRAMDFVAFVFFAYWVWRAYRFAWVQRYLARMYGSNWMLGDLSMRESPMLRKLQGKPRP